MNRYQEVFNIQLLHEYYIDEVCNFIQLQPDSVTQQWINHNGLKFIQNNNTGRLILPDTLSIKQLADSSPNNQLVFDCISSSPQFIKFTDFPIDKLGKFVYKNAPKAVPQTGQEILTNTFETEEKPGTAVASVVINLEQFQEEQAGSPISYVVKFKSRPTVWKYYIINNASEEYQLKLGGTGHELFSGPSPINLVTGAAAQVFDSSPNLIPYKENNTLDLSLLKESAAGQAPEMIIQHLPNANSDSLTASEVDGKKEIHSAIYVYL